MNIGGGEAADQLVRMMLSGTEVAVRLSGSALKNTLALTMALAKHNKVISGKVGLKKMLQQTRDLRQFPMTPEQYQQFSKLAKKQKILFSSIRDKDGRGKLVDVILPVTELDRANLVFERIGLIGQQKAQEEPIREEVMPSKKESPLGRDSPEINSRSDSSRDARTSTRTNERPSVEGRLKVSPSQKNGHKKRRKNGMIREVFVTGGYATERRSSSSKREGETQPRAE